MPIVHFSQGDLAATPLLVRLWRGVILQGLVAVPLVHPVEVVPQSASGVGRHWAPWKMELLFFSVLGGDDLIYLE